MRENETRQDRAAGAVPAERADLVAWRRRHELRRSSAAQPVRSGRSYRRTAKHRKREQDS
ncbi:hypothetical protein EBN03_23595 [Nocardia stercoris]|uniref:Uncharacterized protein n=1 Tax=Nocardia stercoris TaxID=2483361 RepID=A0A3M2KXJ7_9NOCA|nr:hypothetical protein EBN03_23595 [Nocardia stercoris]